MDQRNTTREEDMAYALLGIMGVRMRLDYGERRTGAFSRLRKKIDKLLSDPKTQSCLKDLRITDPRLDKKRVEETKGGLLADAYRWVLDNEDFKNWRCSRDGQLLWVKGDPGKGKTMLLCGIINELSTSIELTGPEDGTLLSYFFCQATDSRINNASAVLRGLIYMLIDQQPARISHVRKGYDSAGEKLFEAVNAWTALTEILGSILADPNLQTIYLVIDALDECGTARANQPDGRQPPESGPQQSEDLSRLLRFIVVMNSALPRVKRIVSSRKWPNIKEALMTAMQKISLSLDLNPKSISEAVTLYIHHKVDGLATAKKYSDEIRCAVRDYFLSHASDTFLWVALVCQSLARTSRRKTLARLRDFPPELGDLYKRMMAYLLESEDAELCKVILAIVRVVYRPVTLDGLACLVDRPDDISDNESLAEIVGFCGSFVTLREHTVFFIHQSAKDFLLQTTCDDIFPSGIEDAHHTIFLRSLQAIPRTLHRDIYSLGALGFPIEQVEQPNPDPLAATRYSCVCWIDHLHGCSSTESLDKYLQDGGLVDTFVR